LQLRDAAGQQFGPGQHPVARALRGEAVLGLEVDVTTPTGEGPALVVGALPLLDGQGDVDTVLLTMQDATAERRRGPAVGGVVGTAVFDHALEGMVLADDDGRYVAVNRAAAAMLGYEPEDLLGRSVVDIVAPPVDAVSVFEEFVASGRSLLELELLRSDGTTVTVEAMAVANVEPGRHLSVWRDVTVRRQAEDALLAALERERAATEELVALGRMKDTFLSAVSHELRTPLTAIVGFGATLSQHGDVLDRERRIGLVDRLVANAHRLQALLDELLDVNRLQRGASVVNARPTSLRAVASASVAVVAATAADSHDFVMDVPDLEVLLDAAKVERIIENLVANAARHTPSGTRVEVRIAVEGDQVTIEVEDDGPGISDEFGAVAFDMFAKGGSDRARAQGTGVGLALVREFAALLGGSAELGDGQLGGALFRVTLPLVSPSAGTDDED
jgi:PAS domain S-box-containing protein